MVERVKCRVRGLRRSIGALACAWLVAFGSACSSDSDDEASSSGGSSSDASAPVDPAALQIVFNEYSAVGTLEWLELANAGSSAFDLSGYAVADSEKGTTTPKTSDALRFPSGTSIPAGGYVLVLTSKDDASDVLSTDCIAGGPVTCFHAKFGISAANGESIHLLGAADNVIATTAYPRNLGADPATNQTVCRIPNLTGDFATCAATPGAANATP